MEGKVTAQMAELANKLATELDQAGFGSLSSLGSTVTTISVYVNALTMFSLNFKFPELSIWPNSMDIRMRSSFHRPTRPHMSFQKAG